MPLKPAALRNPLSILGMVVAATSAVVFIAVFLLDLFGLHTNPYLGILFFLLLPTLFIAGLVLVPIGVWRERRRIRAGHPASVLRWPSLDLNDPVQRRAAAIVVVLTCVNVVIASLATYRGIEFMDSVAFCGQVCHTVMQPEFVAYQDSPHARVACVECHIGSGASWFARSKLSGTRQVFAVLFHTYERPIPWPVQNLRPARETCEQCHWPAKFHGDQIVVKHQYADDDKNTDTMTTLAVHVGGGDAQLGIAQGIHWHMNVANTIEYIATDDKRQNIPYVWLKDRFGNVREYVVDGTTPQELAKGQRRRMDCMDCHNRPSHKIAQTADEAVNAAMALNEIPRSLPFAHQQAVKAVSASYPSYAAADAAIQQSLEGFYRQQLKEAYQSRRGEIDQAITATRNIFHRNVFPAMNVTFGTYPSNIGHMDSPGCFRCHDGNHKTKDGRVIPQDCDLCHSIS